jgi:hypothetical protein
MAINPDPNDDKSSGFRRNHAFLIIKEQFVRKWRGLKNFFVTITPNNKHMLKT